MRMATRQRRMDDFDSDGEPPAGEPTELLCEDHNGTYVLPFPCLWVDGAWRSSRSDRQIEANVIGYGFCNADGILPEPVYMRQYLRSSWQVGEGSGSGPRRDPHRPLF